MMMVMDRDKEETPFRSFRMPTREADRQLARVAKESGITVSEFIRRALIIYELFF